MNYIKLIRVGHFLWVVLSTNRIGHTTRDSAVHEGGVEAKMLGVGVATINRDLDPIPSGTKPSPKNVHVAEKQRKNEAARIAFLESLTPEERAFRESAPPWQLWRGVGGTDP